MEGDDILILFYNLYELNVQYIHVFLQLLLPLKVSPFVPLL